MLKKWFSKEAEVRYADDNDEELQAIIDKANANAVHDGPAAFEMQIEEVGLDDLSPEELAAMITLMEDPVATNEKEEKSLDNVIIRG